jgi:hypothetical protein
MKVIVVLFLALIISACSTSPAPTSTAQPPTADTYRDYYYNGATNSCLEKSKKEVCDEKVKKEIQDGAYEKKGFTIITNRDAYYFGALDDCLIDADKDTCILSVNKQMQNNSFEKSGKPPAFPEIE